MHKQLKRQLRRCFELSDDIALDEFLIQLGSEHVSELSTKRLLRGVMSFIGRVDQSYHDAERDLKLRERSLSLSTSELTDAYDNIRRDIEEQNNAVNELKKIANKQLQQLKKPLLNDAVNTIHQLAQVFVDLSEEHKQAKLALQQQKDALDLHAIVSIFDRDGIITYVNQKFCDLNEYAYDELIGHTHELVNPQLKDLPFYPELRRTLEDGKPWHGELEQFSKSGLRHILYATLVPIVNERGKPVRFIAIHTDITRQKELEASLSQSSRFYRSITDAIGEGVYVLDAGGHVTFMNPEAERALGRTQNELENQLLYAMAVPCSADGSGFEELLHHVNQGIPYKSEAHSFEHISGHAFPVALTAVPLRDEKHSIVGHVGVFSDISERKQTEKELHQALNKAELANRTKSEFLANMSHEIRTPMNAILGLTHLALNTSLTPQQQGYIEKANKGASSLLRIINDILDFSKVEAGKLELEEKPFPLKNVLQQVAQIFQSKAQQKGLEFLIDAPFSSEQFVNGDETRIVQILTNLVGNAIKFTEQGFVKVSVQVSPGKDKQWFTFTVEDSGIGMSDAQAASIFKAFNQADASISRRFGGTGLGMTITRRLVEQMNGSITVDSQPGKGSKFTARLLLSAPSFPFSLAQTSLVEDALIWTDNSLPHTVSVLDKMLRHLGHGSQITRTLDSAFDIKADVLFLVCSMPSQSVTAMLKQVEVSNKHIVLVSNRFGEEVTHALNIAGLYFIKVLCQPFLTEDISTLLASGIEQPVHARNEPVSLDDASSISLRMKGKQVLVVEDDPVSQEIISHQLSEILAEVTIANCGKEALTILENKMFDLIIMDSKLPDITGWEVSEILTYEKQLSTPIIGISADGFSDTVERAIEAGMCEHLSKPVVKEDLLCHIDRHIHYSGNNIDILLQHVFAQDDTRARSLQQFLKTYNQKAQHLVGQLSNLDLPISPENVALFTPVLHDASSIGARTLSLHLEKLLNSSSTTASATQVAMQVANSLDRTLKKVSATLCALIEQSHNARIESVELQQQLLHIIQLLEDYDAGAADVLENFYQQNTDLAQLWLIKQAKSKVANYDYEGAVDILSPLITLVE